MKKKFFDHAFSNFESILNYTSHRVNNPFGAAFAFSWVIVNWEAIYFFLFSNLETTKKITYLKALYQICTEQKPGICEYSTNYLPLLVWPASAAILYLFLGAIISNLATGIWIFLDKNSNAIKDKFIEGKTFITEDERDEMYNTFNNIKSEYKENIAKLNTEINSLRKIVTLSEDKEKEIDNTYHESQFSNHSNNTIEDDREKNQKISSSELAEQFGKNSNKHAIEQWICNTFDYDIDFPLHVPKIALVKNVLNELLEKHSLEPRDINLRGIHLRKPEVETILVELKIKNIVSLVNNKTYELSSQGKTLLVDLLLGT
jgi:hypothetical protein